MPLFADGGFLFCWSLSCHPYPRKIIDKPTEPENRFPCVRCFVKQITALR